MLSPDQNSTPLTEMASLSAPMAEKFIILDELIANQYVIIYPVHNLLPSLFYLRKTTNFKNVPKELKQRSKKVFFSWYAFFFSMFAYVQTKLEKDFCVLFGIYMLIFALIPPVKELEYLSNIFGFIFSYYMSGIFVASRYQQYRQFGRVPNSRNPVMTILISTAFFIVAVVAFALINATLYASYYAE